MQRRETGLRVEIYGEDPIASEREILSEMGGGRCLRRAAFEVGDADHLQMLIGPALRKVAPFPLTRFFEEFA